MLMAPGPFPGGSPATVVAVIVLLALLILIHEAGHYLAARSCGVPVRQFGIGFGPALVSWMWHGTRFRLNAIPFGGYCDLSVDAPASVAPEGTVDEAEDADRDDIPRDALEGRGTGVRLWVMAGGIVFNLLGGWLFVMAQMSLQGIPDPRPQDIRTEGILVQQVLGAPARKAGLRTGDHILGMDGRAFSRIEDFGQRLARRPRPAVTLVVRRETATGTATLSLEAEPDASGKIGVGISPPVDMHFRPVDGPLQLVRESVLRTGQIVSSMVHGLVMLFSGGLPLDSVGGPVAIVHMGSRMVRDLAQYLFFGALISLNLAIVNFLPLPALDGGRILLLLVEMVIRRPLPRRIESTIHSVGMTALLALIGLVTLKDILGLLQP